MTRSRWNVLPLVPGNHALNKAGFPPLITQLLFNRHLTEPSQISSFLAGDESLSGDPFLLPDMEPAVTRIYRALLSGENIVVYGDFDTDGITATALLVQGLSMLDSRVTPYIPHRLTEGYGLKSPALETLRQQGNTLVITVDCGITGAPQVKKARRLGMDVIITDHHHPSAEIPEALAVINPKLPNSKYPFTELAGVGVALKLLQALFRGVGKENRVNELIDLVALGTVADMVPLLGENRYVVKQGLKLLCESPRLGIKEIIAQSGINGGGLDAECISWTIAPRLNAAGRLEHGMSSYRLLTTDSQEEAHELAIWLEGKNGERQKLTAKALLQARQQVLDRGVSPLLIAANEDFPAGINGIVAGRLAEEFYRPSVVVRTGEQFSSGSCRSIPEFNIIEAMNQCQRLFLHYGGHAQAAGFTMFTRNLPRFEQVLTELAAVQLTGVDLRPRIDIDAEVTLSALSGNTFQSIQKLAPFGQGNPAPIFLSRHVGVLDCRPMGNDGQHLKLKLKQSGVAWSAVAFGLGGCLADFSSPLDIVYNLELDRWGGNDTLRLNVLDFARSNNTTAT